MNVRWCHCRNKCSQLCRTLHGLAACRVAIALCKRMPSLAAGDGSVVRLGLRSLRGLLLLRRSLFLLLRFAACICRTGQLCGLAPLYFDGIL